MTVTRTALANGTAVPDVFLSPDLLRAILVMNDKFGSFTINAITGGDHTERLIDEHYRGYAVDFQGEGWSIVDIRDSNWNQFPRRDQWIPIATFNEVLEYLESAGFITQRSPGSQTLYPSPPRQTPYIGEAPFFHLEIWGRN